MSRAVDATAADDKIDARPKAHIRAANLREILSAAEQVFARHGFQGATIAEVARVSGLTKPSVHYYVGTKEKPKVFVIPRRFQLVLGEQLPHLL